MYNPDGSDAKREWVEVYNDTDNSIDLTEYGLLENDVNHGISYYTGPAELASGQYAIIASDAATFSNEYSLSSPIYDSVFTLNNTGEAIELLGPDDESLSKVSYKTEWGAADDGNSLNLIDSNWQPRKPTPGSTPSDTTLSDTTSSTAKKNRTLSPINTDANEIEGISTESMPDVVVAGQSVPFNIIGPSRTRYYWQTSDGESFTGSSNKLRFDMPGQASVAIEVRYQDGKTDQIVHQVTIEPIKLRVSLGEYQGEKYIRLKNNNAAKIDISNWVVNIDSGQYELPDKLILYPNDDYAFTITSRPNVIVIKSATGKVVFEYHEKENNVGTANDIDDKTVIAQSQPIQPTAIPVRTVTVPESEVGSTIDEGIDEAQRQEMLRTIFESYDTPSDQEVELNGELIATATPNTSAIASQSLPQNTKSSTSIMINVVCTLLLGAGLVLLYQSKAKAYVGLVESDQKTSESDTVDDYEIIEVDDEEDF
tara:strand:- start:379 stop:1824 length:1446 start_codon:yes stop_codon:yes gene_type:complete